ncbi:hypothetical protein DOY81_008932 [Sarcophaga bullata]|nr:hypothetical protein DOY81_008932 [Sarcophaga bullata]
MGSKKRRLKIRTSKMKVYQVPQLKLNAKGELILDDKSLVIETTAEQEARKVLANSSLIYLDENTGMNGFYSRQKRTREWLPAETIKFYRCLQNVGTDFSLMVSLFPNRTRRDLKLKFKKEERKNGHLINKALLYPKQFNLEALKQQIDDEEKLREEQAKNTKEAKKRSKKRKLSTSAADRVLQSDAVYQNENVQKQKRVRKTVASEKNENRTATSAIETDLKETCKNFENNVVDQKPQQTSQVYSDSSNTTVDPENSQANDEGEIDINENNIESNIIAENKIPDNNTENKPKRRRRRTPNKVAQKEEITIIKEEIIKIENKQDSNNPSERLECPDGTQLQTEMDELLNTDVTDINFSNSSCGMETLNTFDETQVSQPSDVVNTPLYSPYISQNGDNYYPADMDIDKYEHRTIVNLDDGSVNVYSKMEDYNHFNTKQPPTQPTSPPRSQTPIVETQPYMPPQTYNDNNPAFSAVPEPEIFNNETCSSVISERELNEEDIQTILTELADGSLVLVSSLDPDDPDKVLNEIYMVDKDTGELCDEPLNIPDNIVQCILSVVS